MKFGRTLTAVAAALALAALGGAANAQKMTGSVTGRWQQVDDAHVAAQAVMFTQRDRPAFTVDMTLYGRDAGSVAGLVTPIEHRGTQLYRLVGTYALGTDGFTYVTARIVLNIGPIEAAFAPQVPHVVGMFYCRLDANRRIFPWEPTTQMGSGTDPTPWMRPLNGHVHGRWWMLMN